MKFSAKFFSPTLSLIHVYRNQDLFFDQVSKYHSKVAPAYGYLLASRCNNFSFGEMFNAPNVTRELVAHADDLPCIFKHDGVFLGEPTKEQEETIKAMVKEWTSFAKNMKV